MSSIYDQEPPTSGKVILKTNYGPIDIDLWCTETPRTCRNFIQLCMEGYHDGTIFHRIIKGFMVQGGDPTGTGTGGESIYEGGKPFQDEFHSRLKFSRRGIVGMANPGQPNQNGSQFFMAVDECSWLDKKHTVFGKVAGPTIFNLLKIGEVETEEGSDRPIGDPIPQIVTCEIVSNPFDDILPRNIKRNIENFEDNNALPLPQKQFVNNQNASRNKNFLSFQDEEDDFGDPTTNDGKTKKTGFFKKKILSSHEVLKNKDPTLSAEQVIPAHIIQEQIAKQKQNEKSEKLKNELKDKIKMGCAAQSKDQQIDQKVAVSSRRRHLVDRKPVDLDKEIEMLEKKSRKRMRMDSAESSDGGQQKTLTAKVVGRAEKKARKEKQEGRDRKSQESSDSEGEEEAAEQKEKAKQEKLKELELQKTRDQYESIRADLLKLNQAKVGSLLDETNLDVQTKVSALDLQRQKYLRSKKMTKNRENDTLAKLKSFTKKINGAKSGKDPAKNQEWLGREVKFHIDSQKAYNVTKAAEYGKTIGTGVNFEKYKENITGPGNPIYDADYDKDFQNMQELLKMAKQKIDSRDLGAAKDVDKESSDQSEDG